MKGQRNINPEHKPKKRSWRLDRPPVPGSKKPVREFVGGLSYQGLNAELRKLGFKTTSWSPR
jgi:hypothetical protein